MEGVMILNERIVPNMNVLLIFIVIMACVVSYALIYALVDGWKILDIGTKILTICCIILLGSMVIISAISMVIHGFTDAAFDVILDDTVSYNDFESTYSVLYKNGRIYTVVLKDK